MTQTIRNVEKTMEQTLKKMNEKNTKNYETSKKLRCNELSGYSLPDKKNIRKSMKQTITKRKKRQKIQQAS